MCEQWFDPGFGVCTYSSTLKTLPLFIVLLFHVTELTPVVECA